MFAPRSGRYLWVSAAGLALLTFGGLDAWVPGSWAVVGLLGAGWALWVFFAVFFRDPDRGVGEGIVAAADGRVRAVETDGRWVTVSTFMNVYDVHVNRFPLDARVATVETAGRGARPAYREDAHHNRRRHYLLETRVGPVEVIQMTGFVARRLVSLVHPGEAHAKGTRLGMILLGSRVDVRLPSARVRVRVHVGDRLTAGVSTIAEEIP